MYDQSPSKKLPLVKQFGHTISFEIVGRGVFTTIPFRKGDFLLHYKGDLISATEGEEREEKYPEDVGNFLYFFTDNGKTCWYVFKLQVQYHNIQLACSM